MKFSGGGASSSLVGCTAPFHGAMSYVVSHCLKRYVKLAIFMCLFYVSDDACNTHAMVEHALSTTLLAAIRRHMHPLQPRGWWELTGPASSALSFISMWVSWWWLLVSFKSVAVVMNGGRIMFSSMPGCTCTIYLLLSAAILCILCLALALPHS